MIKNKRVLITGAAGSIGSELLRQLAPHNRIFCLDQNETGLADLLEEHREFDDRDVYGRVGDVRDIEVIRDIFSDFKPQVVFHAAALKHVPINETYPEEAIKTNVLGTLNMIQVVKSWDCVEKFVFISTDKAVSSNSIMGATKRLGEILVKNQGKGFVVIRFANVLGSRGSVIPIWQKQIDENKPITVTHKDMKRYFMSIEEAIDLVIQAAEIGKGGEIIILDMDKQVNILDMAKEILGKSGKDLPIKMIGARPGETLFETLMFEEEEKIAKKEGKFFIIK
jgi:FlaA1/EpsC-like NDP-sugar epimerase